MNRPSFWHGVLVAAGLAFVGTVLWSVVPPITGRETAARLLIPLMSLAYVFYLLATADARTGRVVTVSLWSALAVGAWWLSPPLPAYVLIHVGVIWLVRSLYFYSGVIPALLDGLLSGFAAGAFVWAATRTDSIFLSTWTYFLVQSLFVLIPARIGPRKAGPAAVDSRRFERAKNQADAALRQLATR